MAVALLAMLCAAEGQDVNLYADYRRGKARAGKVKARLLQGVGVGLGGWGLYVAYQQFIVSQAKEAADRDVATATASIASLWQAADLQMRREAAKSVSRERDYAALIHRAEVHVDALEGLLDAAGRPVTKAARSKLTAEFQALDENRDGSLTFEEYRKGLAQRRGKDAGRPEAAREAFNLMDGNGDGVVTETEWLHFAYMLEIAQLIGAEG